MNSESFYTQSFFYSHYVFKGAKLAKFIRFEAVGKMIRDTRCELRGVSISITKFTELWWNDGVFEGSEEHWKLWRCEVEIFCFLKRFFTMLCFVQNDRVLFCSHGLKIRAIGMRYELRDASISITKFTEIGWNDCVFDRTEEHQRCSGKCTGFSVYVCRKEPILL